MTIEHVLSDMDTPQSLSYQYFGNADSWQTITDYNQLDYPYIAVDPSVRASFIASGWLKVTRSSVVRATLLKGSTFCTKHKPTTMTINTYATTRDIVFANNVTSMYVPVTCLDVGTKGNVLANTITAVGTILGSISGITAVTNESDITNGEDRKIKLSGEVIYIPIEDTTTEIMEDVYSYIETLGGRDLVLTDYLLDADATGDLASVSGLENIIEAIQSRLLTERGELPLHPEYGTGVATLIGKARLPYTDNLIQLDIIEALAQEDRIQNVQITDYTVDGTAIYIELSFQPYGLDSTESLSLRLDYSGRA